MNNFNLKTNNKNVKKISVKKEREGENIEWEAMVTQAELDSQAWWLKRQMVKTGE